MLSERVAKTFSPAFRKVRRICTKAFKGLHEHLSDNPRLRSKGNKNPELLLVGQCLGPVKVGTSGFVLGT